jgi:hypothetical protein
MDIGYVQRLVGFHPESMSSEYQERKHGLVYFKQNTETSFAIAICTSLRWVHIRGTGERFKNPDQAQKLADLIIQRRAKRQPIDDIEIVIQETKTPGMSKFIGYRIVGEYEAVPVAKVSQEERMKALMLLDSFGLF